MSFESVIAEYREHARSKRELGDSFERLIQRFLKTYQIYSFKEVWMWNEFPYRDRFGGVDLGIDLVALTNFNEFAAVQCKCYREDESITKEEVDSFLSNSGRFFYNESGEKVRFKFRLWVSTTDKWSPYAEEALKNQDPEVTRLSYTNLKEAKVDWDKLASGVFGDEARIKRFEPMEHQKEAIFDVHEYFKSFDRGKLVMACGTGKTYTALKIAENETGGGGLVLVLVPSIALIGQTLRQWSAESQNPINPICICSDATASKGVKRSRNSDEVGESVVDLAMPATTDVDRIVREYNNIVSRYPDNLVVFFSTYQSIDVVSDAQKAIGKEFDLIICDEAHRTTGVYAQSSNGDEDNKKTKKNKKSDERSSFVKVHDNEFLRSKKRLYMTATPRMYDDSAKRKAAEMENVMLWSMDDKSVYGEEIYRLNFGKAVELGLLSDYKVLILALNDKSITKSVQELVDDVENEFNANDACSVVGCINALSKRVIGEGAEVISKIDSHPMRRAVAFCSNIAVSKRTTDYFNAVSAAYSKDVEDGLAAGDEVFDVTGVEARHIDGSMSSYERDGLVGWLKGDEDDSGCKVLTNVRCLSEGVDVPSLDAVIFMSRRSSQIEVVQSVGRVMRTSPGKRFGYIIVPIVVKSDVSPEEALSDEKSLEVIWSVLNALRAHDERLDAYINKISLNKGSSGSGGGGGGDGDKPDDGGGETGEGDGGPIIISGGKLDPKLKELSGILYAKMVLKVGTRQYWDLWGARAAKAAEDIIKSIEILTKRADVKSDFDKFVASLRSNLNESVTDKQAVEMLAQHIITKPIFEALFENYSFAQSNPVSVSMQRMLEILSRENVEKDTKSLDKSYERARQTIRKVSGIEDEKRAGASNLHASNPDASSLHASNVSAGAAVVVNFEKKRLGTSYYDKDRTGSGEGVFDSDEFYRSVRDTAKGIDSYAGRQDIIRKLYDNFFKTAFPKMVEQLGIVYTPTEVVDFIIKSVDDISRREFSRGLTDNGVNILDPFTGTGTFIARLLEMGVIEEKDLERKYKSEIFANEIVLLAYYIASINIENAYHSKLPEGSNYSEFEGICLTDTFKLLDRKEEHIAEEFFPVNSDRVEKEIEKEITIIIGNPPYSAGQRSANDNAQNLKYPNLDRKIAETYIKDSNVTNKNSLYDSYIRAFRWSTDRLENKDGIICFVSNGGWLDSNAADGFRKHLEKDFSSIYVFNLRGNARTSGEIRRKEAGNVFDSGSRTPITVTLLVKKAKYENEKAVIYYHDIGDYLSREDKLSIIRDFGSVANIDWKILTPDEHNDWINLRNPMFDTFIPIGDKKGDEKDKSFFVPYYSRGLGTSRDVWCYNSSKDVLIDNISKSIDYYNNEVDGFAAARSKDRTLKVEDFVKFDSTKFVWALNQKKDLERGKKYEFDSQSVITGLYRPFFKQNLYYNKELNDAVYLLPKLFPTRDTKNKVICISGIGVTKEFTALITDTLPDLEVVGKSQCFPLFYYEDTRGAAQKTKEIAPSQATLFGAGAQAAAAENEAAYFKKKSAISPWILAKARAQYGDEIRPEDIFYYVYGFLHSKEYRKVFSNDLKKMLARLPLVESRDDFWAFSKAGRELADLHINYEDAEEYAGVIVEGRESGEFAVKEMKFAKLESKKEDKSVILYNEKIKIVGVPKEAYEYVVNGKSAVEWVMERYRVSVDKDSGIRNDANDWGAEIGDEGYILSLLLKVISVSVKTVEVVEGLPEVRFAS